MAADNIEAAMVSRLPLAPCPGTGFVSHLFPSSTVGPMPAILADLAGGKRMMSPEDKVHDVIGVICAPLCE
jgi:hypothetical protein